MKSQDKDESVEAVLELSRAVHVLREKGVIRSRRFPDDLAEWYVCELYSGKTAPGGKEGCRDVCVSEGGHRLRVKAHLYDPEQPWAFLDSIPTDFDRLVVVILTNYFTISAVYDVPVEELGTVIRMGDERKPFYAWDDLEPWRVDPSALPGYGKLAPLFEPGALPAKDRD